MHNEWSPEEEISETNPASEKYTVPKILVLVSKISEHWREALDVRTNQKVPYASSTSRSLLLAELPLIQTAASPAPRGARAGNQWEKGKSCLAKTLSSAKGLSEHAQPSERRMLGKENLSLKFIRISLLGHCDRVLQLQQGHLKEVLKPTSGSSVAVPWAHPHPWCRLLPAGPQLAGGCWGALQLGRMLDLQPAAPRANGVRGWPQGRDTFQRWGNTARGIRGLGLEVCMNQRRGSQQNAAAAADVSTLHSSRVNRYFSFYFD